MNQGSFHRRQTASVSTDCEIFLMIKNSTALEAGEQPGIGYAKTCGNFGDEEVPGAKQTEGNFGQQHREMSNMPCYNCCFGKAESDGTL